MNIYDFLTKDQIDDIAEILREYGKVIDPMEKINGDVPAPAVVVLMIKELMRKGFKIEHEFEATNIFTVSPESCEVKWKDEFVREIRAFGKEDPDLVAMLKSSGFERVKPGFWAYKPKPKKLVLPR